MKDYQPFEEELDAYPWGDEPDEDWAYTYNYVHDLLERYEVEPYDALIKELIDFFDGEDHDE